MEKEARRIFAQELEKAIFSMQNILGRATVELIIADLETYGGISFGDRDRTYTIDEIERAVTQIFGDAAPLLMERIRKSLFFPYRGWWEIEFLKLCVDISHEQQACFFSHQVFQCIL